MNDTSLLSTISNIVRVSEPEPVSRYSSALLSLLSEIPFLHCSTKKHLLDCTRTQSPQKTNRSLRKSYDQNVQQYPITVIPISLATRLQYLEIFSKKFYSLLFGIYTYILLNLFENFCDSLSSCCVLSYMVRAERTVFASEFVSIGTEGIYKEIMASTNLPQANEYSGLFTDEPRSIHAETALVPHETIRLWQRRLFEIRSKYLEESTIILPHYSKRKNIGYKSQAIYSLTVYGDSFNLRSDITTLDLLKWYHHTGEQIQGPLELRQAWKFNDLKPRSYYCLGGESFWAATYIKSITNDLLMALPSTHPFSRYEVQRIRPLSRDELFVTYDYSSFTTSLAELKYFLWYVGTSLKGTPMTILDVKEGVKTIDLGQYLLDYNESVNFNQMFDVSRLLGQVDTEIIFQNRNGSLGVGGNIGLSGICHGLSLAGFNDTPDQDSVVGDDAALKTLKSLLELLIVITNKLGHIHPEKVTSIPVPPTLVPQESFLTSFKYLKRPIRVLPNGIVETGVLDFFPNLAPCLFPEGDGIHDPPRHDPSQLVESYIMQVGKFCTNLLKGFSPEEVDCELVLVILRSVYHKYNLPIEGAIPTHLPYLSRHIKPDGTFTDISVTGTLWIPPLDTLEVYSTPWMNILFNRFSGMDCVVPHLVDGEILPPTMIYAALEFQVTGLSKFLTLCEDLGYFESRAVMQTRTFDDHLFMNMTEAFAQGMGVKNNLRPLYTVRVLDVPHFYSQYVDILFSEEDGPIIGNRELELESLGFTLTVKE